MKEIKCIQGGPEWWSWKRGVPSASNFSRILVAKSVFQVVKDGNVISSHRTRPTAIARCLLGNKKGGTWEVHEETPISGSADEYIAELIGDLANQSPNFFTSRGTEAMRNGQTTEQEARKWFELAHDCHVRETGVCFTDDWRFCCSPDGLIDPDEGLELKCPGNKQHALWLAAGGLPNEHKAQVHGCLHVTGRKRWWFMSYSPPLKPLVVAVDRDSYTERLGEALESFWTHYQAMREKVYPVTATEKAVWAWVDFMHRASLEELNRQLPTLSELQHEAKAAVWERIRLYTQAKGLVFNDKTKEFGKVAF